MNHLATLGHFLPFTLQAVAIACCLWIPGHLLLRSFLGDRWHELPAFRKLGYSLPLSILVLALVQALIFLLPPAPVRVLVWGLFLSCLGAAAVEVWRSRGGLLDARYQALATILLAFLLAVLWLTSTADLPGPVRAGYGDLPAYYRVIDKLSRGDFPLVDFRIGELVGERYFLPTSYPLLTLVSAFFKTIFTGHRHLLTVVCILLGFAGLLFCGGYLHDRRASGRLSSRLAVLSLGLLPLLPIGNTLEFALGAVTLPLLTLALILWDLTWGTAIRPLGRRVALAAACALALALARPGGLLFAVLLAGAGLPWVLYRCFVTGSRRGKAAVAAGALGLLAAAFLVPYDRLLGKAPAFLYLQYEASTGDFRYHRIPSIAWWDILYDNVRENLGLPRSHTQQNSELAAQALAHPAALAGWLGSTLVRQLGHPSLLVLAASTILLVASRSPPSVILAVVGWSYLAVLTAINPAFFQRHSLPVRTLLFVVAFSHLAPIWRARLSGPLPGRLASVSPILLIALPLMFLGFVQGLDLRRQEAASPYLSIIRALRPVTDSTSRVAASYPQLMSYSLGVEAVGNAILSEVLESLIVRESPDFIVLDDTRVDLPGGYADGRRFVETGRAAELGYTVLADDPRQRFLILEKALQPTGAAATPGSTW